MANESLTTVHIGEYMVASAGTLVVYGLGSCVALLLFDREREIGGMAHVLLPGPRPRHDESNDLPAKYGTEAISSLSAALCEQGAVHSALRSALIGGARLFRADQEVDNGIGPRNVAALRAALLEAGHAIVAEEVGGNAGRTIYFGLPRCTMEVKTLAGGRRSVPTND